MERGRWLAVVAALVLGVQVAGAGTAAADLSPAAPLTAASAAPTPDPNDQDPAAPPPAGPDLIDLPGPDIPLPDPAQFPDMDLINWDTVFAPWGDPRLYTLVAGGDAESGSRWNFTGGGFIAYGNEPWRVWNVADRRSAVLLSGSSATLRTTDHFAAELRFFVQRATTSSSAWLKVTVTAQNADGTTATITHRVEGSTWVWAASDPLPVPDVRGADGVQYLTITFEPIGRGSWRVDDVALDPWRSG